MSESTPAGGTADESVPDDAAVLDRVEDGIAVLLVGPDEVEVGVPVRLLPVGARDGDWFRLLVPDPDRTAARREALGTRLEALRRTRRGGRFGT